MKYVSKLLLCLATLMFIACGGLPDNHPTVQFCRNNKEYVVIIDKCELPSGYMGYTVENQNGERLVLPQNNGLTLKIGDSCRIQENIKMLMVPERFQLVLQR